MHSQAQAGATEGLIVKVRFNKTVRFSLGGGGVGPSEDHRWSEARGVSSQMKAEQAQQREVFSELSAPKTLCICAAAARSDRSLSQLCPPLQQVRCGAPRERLGKLRSAPLRIRTHAPYFFLTVAVSGVHTAERVGKQTHNQSKSGEILFLF